MAGPELTSGYCHRCGGYGQGEYAETLSLWSDAITNHIDCPESVVPEELPRFDAEGPGERRQGIDVR